MSIVYIHTNDQNIGINSLKLYIHFHLAHLHLKAISLNKQGKK